MSEIDTAVTVRVERGLQVNVTWVVNAPVDDSGVQFVYAKLITASVFKILL